ncbi:Gfo/Idh/MocA family protein [Terribacillus sp. DMT04]|uniref:Gfo/Idh/MocA family protein n=1 Tax=Terribacillus sp. DMT04 TaxID=2850441 RepID=UPI001C2C26D1|nr:Gfo/Idh/MocA family oxidoreductase [Terribacillus sp. DMT04]QXE02011.1 Gfo/Idh/MocA family oxidoreductase [Terribacillus sp. DMT04]
MAAKKIGIIMNGVTGRMGTNQHLIRSIAAIRAEGGVLLSNGERLLPDPILVGRNEEKLSKLARENNVERYSTDLEAALADDYNVIYFDSQTTNRREKSIKQAIQAGKHIYCEKPTATSLEGSLELARLAREAGVKNGVVQDKLFLPGLLKLKHLIDSNYFGDILSVKLDFGYWVFEGDWQEAQRPSWNYRAEDGGGIIVDMFAHWRYVIDHLFGEIDSMTCIGATHIPYRVDEAGNRYKATADDAAYAIFALKNGVVVQANSSWTTRVDRDDLVTFQVDGTLGSAVAGLRDCKVQHRVSTPKPVWNPDIPNTIDFRSQWESLPENRTYDNGFKIQWEQFLRHVEEDAAFPWDLLEGAKGTQLSDLGLEAWHEKKWVTVPSLEI